ncbi:unnamed protein product [Dovyalis caffra]|uniref:Uncharacterized protein n=1 Tax=Dovyalis caffra TaxID=77055 RepID=A0AAV1QUD8_9ROSI|nr:unnamed protein product [Dovyalis caffra]
MGILKISYIHFQMAVKVGSSFSCLATSLSSPFKLRRTSQACFVPFYYASNEMLGIFAIVDSECILFNVSYKSKLLLGVKVVACQNVVLGMLPYVDLSLSERPYNGLHYKLRNADVHSCHVIDGLSKLKGNFPRRQHVLFGTSQDQSHYSELKPDTSEQDDDHPTTEALPSTSSSINHFPGTDGKPGLISFYNRPYKKEDEVVIYNVQRNPNSLLWFIGPAVLVASFIFPSLYLRRILSAVFEDSLLTDFLILFFTEALFYCGVAVFLLLIDHLRRPVEPASVVNDIRTLTPQLGQRISSVAALVLNLIVPMVTMGLVWPWTGPAASATLAPYLVGIVVQFAFEQYARYWKSPSWPVIPIIFQVYRLHQLNRAAQLVTALSFTVRGAEMTSHNLEISSSLGTLLNVLQFLGVICIWSLSSFLMKFFPPTARSNLIHVGFSDFFELYFCYGENLELNGYQRIYLLISWWKELRVERVGSEEAKVIDGTEPVRIGCLCLDPEKLRKGRYRVCR